MSRVAFSQTLAVGPWRMALAPPLRCGGGSDGSAHGGDMSGMSVAAALAEAHHHSAPKVGAEPYDAPRSQKTASAGTRPGVLKDPEPQGRGSHGQSRGCPSASPGGGGDDVDATTTKYLQRQKEEEKERRRVLEEKAKKAEHEKEMPELRRRVRRGESLSAAEEAAWWHVIGLPPQPPRRKRKKG